MSNAIMPAQDVWQAQQLEEIRKLFAPKLNDKEFQFFVGLGKAAKLNPFTREIWCIKYDEKSPAQVFIGRDGYRKVAQGHPEYDYHQTDAVYENDKFSVIDGVPNHEYTMADRGKLVGAYCIAKRHKSSRPMYVFAELSEYSTYKSTWKDKPATMIKKVAESQCLRAAFQDILGGTYGEEEMERVQAQAPAQATVVERVNDRVEDVKQLMYQKGAVDYVAKALVKAGVSTLSELDADKLDALISKLTTKKDVSQADALASQLGA